MSKPRLPRAGIFRRIVKPGDVRHRILLWSTLLGLLFGAIEFGEPLEDAMRIVRNAVRKHPVSGEIVVVAIDDRSLKAMGDFPWPRTRTAQLIDAVQTLGPERTFVDLSFASDGRPDEDAALQRSLAAADQRITLAVQTLVDPVSRRLTEKSLAKKFQKYAEVGSIGVQTNFSGYVWDLPYFGVSADSKTPSFAAKLAMAEGRFGKFFQIDYANDPRSVPTISAIDVVQGRYRAQSLAGKDVIVGMTSPALGDQFRTPGYGYIPGVYLHVLGAETLKSGTQRQVSWVVPFFAALAMSIFGLRVNLLRTSLLVFGTGTALLLAIPVWLEAGAIVMDIVPALFLLIAVTIAWGSLSVRRSYRIRGTVNAGSGLLNLDSLRAAETDGTRMLIAARIHNYAQIASALSAEDEQELIAQIARRLTLGMGERTLHQGDEGIFAWLSDLPTVEAVGEHLEALHGFFRNSVTLGDRQVDLTLSFGVDAGNDRSLANRLGSALVACDEAATEGRRWKAFDPAALQDAEWKLSLLGQLDRAIDSGDFWVAYQAKLDLVTGEICGAEALARWTHPDKGAIAPLDFIIAAEQNDRIEKLTRFVLDDAIKAASMINAAGVPFDVAVNLSTRMIGDRGFVGVVEDLLKTHGLAPRYLTLEVTETAALSSVDDDLTSLGLLRDLGVNISIDDYGTGLSTLEYLKKIPATEIKIDQSFIASITKNQSDRLMVRSTVQLAHSLGRAVVAEGVEDRATLQALAAMGCDHAQGFFIGRPMPLSAFTDALIAHREQRTKKFG